MDGSSVFDPVAFEVGLVQGSITLRKLQLLYWLRSQHPLTGAEMLRGLAQWRGTGRNEVVQMEAAVSAPGLVEQMVKDELMWEMGAPVKRLVVSPMGIALLSRLHPACEDLDLPWRLARWEGARPSSMAEVGRYGNSLAARQRAAGASTRAADNPR